MRFRVLAAGWLFDRLPAPAAASTAAAAAAAAAVAAIPERMRRAGASMDVPSGESARSESLPCCWLPELRRGRGVMRLRGTAGWLLDRMGETRVTIGEEAEE